MSLKKFWANLGLGGKKPTIEADAAAILSSATRAVKVILERRAALDRAGKQDQTLLVVEGEEHDRPGHSAFHLMVIEGVRRGLSGQGLVVGRETPHNQLEQIFSKVAHSEKPDAATVAALRAQDRAGALSLTAYMGFFGSTYADHSGKTLGNYLRRHNIATCFSDAARNNALLAADDPSTAASMVACLGKIKPGISILSAEGMHVRNHHMLNTLLPFAREHSARIAFQISGANHIAGGGGSEARHPARFSLTGLAEKDGIPVLGVLLCNSEIPADHGLLPEERLFENNVPSLSARYHPGTDQPKQADLPSRAAEAAYLEGLLRHVGRTDDILTVDQLMALQLQCQQEIEALPAQLARGGPS